LVEPGDSDFARQSVHESRGMTELRGVLQNILHLVPKRTRGLCEDHADKAVWGQDTVH